MPPDGSDAASTNVLARAGRLLFPLLLPLVAAQGQSSQRSAGAGQLARTITVLDSVNSDAFARCDLESFGAAYAEDVEFYHYRGGLTKSRRAVVESVRDNGCGRARRDLAPGSHEVYPISGYGAVETGVHRFCDLQGKVCDEAERFVNVWRQTNGKWQIVRAISYQAPTPRQ